MSTDENEMTLPERPSSKAGLMALIERYWADLNGEIGALSEAAMVAPGPGGGWSIKDHMAHLTIWERVSLARIEQQPEHGIFGMDEAAFADANNLDELNARAHERERGKPLADVLAAFAATHQELVSALERLSDDELARPVFPDNLEFGALFGNAVGDTYEHYIEHLTWIRAARA
ncbi:MAG: DinB family protein [Ktedonobacterales bacterium]